LAGALYALIALAFVVVYKASGVINFALGEWVLLAAALVATGLHVLGLQLPAAMAVACFGMFTGSATHGWAASQTALMKPADQHD
jgi:branched-chain amino acid transport system permease protein